MAQVFISYKSEEYKFASQVKSRIESYGYDVWIDREHLRPGEDWREDIDSGIQSSFALILIISPKALESKYMIYEFAYAEGLGIKTIPIIKTKGIEAREFHPRLEGRQHIPFFKVEEIEERYIELQKRLDAIGNIERLLVNPTKYPSFIQLILEKLDTADDQNERKKILNQLLGNKHPAVNDFLGELSNGYHWTDIPPLAGIYLAKRTDYEDKRAIPGLLLAISSIEFYTQAMTHVKQIHKFGKAVEEPLIAMLYHDWMHARQHAAIALGNLKSKEAVSKLIEQLNNKTDYGIHHYVIEALVKINASEAIEAIKPHLKSENIEATVSAIKAISHFSCKEEIKTLIDLLHSEHQKIQIASENALMSFGDEVLTYFDEYLKQLDKSKAIEPKNVQVLYILQRIGEKISSDSAIELLGEYTKSEDKNIRLNAIMGLGLSKNMLAIPYFRKGCNDDYGINRALSAFLIGEFEDSSGEEYLLPLLSDPNPTVRVFTIISLGRIKSVQAVSDLIPMLTDCEFVETISYVPYKGRICDQVANSLEQIGTLEALKAVEEWREDQLKDS